MVQHKVFRSILCLGFLFIAAGIANAQAARTWISGVGDDVNPCSRTAPCKTFAGAISKTAVNGEINCLDPGGFGAVTITKSITLDCSGTFGNILASQTNGIIINITSDADTRKFVRIRGLQINGTANGLNGLRVIAASRVIVENVLISGFTQSGIAVLPAAGNADVTVSDSSITLNTTGINAGANATVRLNRNTITYNTTGISGAGKIYSFGNNVLDGNGTNGTPSSTTPLK
jgi:hypothetical protein